MRDKRELKKEFKLVFSAKIARKLLKAGCVIADIKADKTNPDKSVFVFKRTPEFEVAFEAINKEIAEKELEVQE